ncbi:hypothetical protein FRB95_003794 [Tulasnella sp. JGI-2019a]|nr:hypothetical protein FRB95_003794 [Tulasnella sp. JGI-2019a]
MHKATSVSILSLLAVLPAAKAQLTARTMTFVNKCTSDVWIQPTTGAAGSCSAGCPGGSTCASNGNCYWNNPTPSSGNYRVPKGGSNQIVYPAYPGVGTAWNGNYAFCQSGTTCSQTAAVCDTSGCGTTGPYGLAEFNLAQVGTDFYDVSIIAGVSVPISITPNTVDSTNVVAGNPYACGNPGSPNPDTATLGASSWGLTPPSNVYQWVTPPSLTSLTTCTSNSACPSGQTCGVIFQSSTFKEVCGYLSGYWSEGAICGFNSPTSLFNCAQSVTNGPYTTTISAFQGCGGTSGSCYSGGADTNCCGCANWNNVLGTNYVPASTAQCVNNNPTWTADILPTLEFLKKGCPNCYTFPYDDFSSTFTCQKTVGGYNQQNYTITLCPSGVSFGGTGGSTSVVTSATSTSTATTGTTTGTATCSGVSYNPSTSVCDQGKVCPTGQYSCAGTCYSPSSKCCSSGALVASSGTCTCNGQGFGGTAYACDGTQLCPAGTYNCGGACYSPSLYGCCNGALTAAGKGC